MKQFKKAAEFASSVEGSLSIWADSRLHGGIRQRIFRPASRYGHFATMTAMAALMVLSRPALAGPRGGTVVDGAAAISQAGNATNINQSSNKAIINWQGFSVGANESVNFHQPGASSVTLNRVIGNESSVINGALNANGQVFIVNSAGVLFGKGSQVNVGGLVASTHDISNKDFMTGNYTFSGTSNASVVNQGRIRAHGGGYVALLGKTVSNEGVIAARLGTVAMSAGEKLTLNFDGNSLLDVTIDKGALNALVANKRAIRADGGRVILTAKAADQLLSAQVNNTGIVQARTVAALKGGSTKVARKGNIKIYAEGGTANIAGKLDASAPKGGDGGFIETSGDKVKVAEGTKVTTLAPTGKTGTWLIDPNDFTIAATGGDMTAAQVASHLTTTNFEIATATMGHAGGKGDINVNQALTWNSDTTLTLTAARNVNINQAVTANGDAAGLTLNAGADININAPVTLSGDSAALAMTYGGDYNILTPASYSGAVLDANGKPVSQVDPHDPAKGGDGVYGSITLAGANASLKINGQAYTLIHSISALDLLDDASSPYAVTGSYALAQDLNAAGTTYVTSLIGNLNGTFTGLGHKIDGLSIVDRTAYTSSASPVAAGLIGSASAGSVIRDVGLTNVNIDHAAKSVGALLGISDGAITVSNAYSTGVVAANSTSASTTVGGLIGKITGSSVESKVTNAFSLAEVKGAPFSVAGGLIGAAGSGTSLVLKIENSHATGGVTGGGAWVGALAGTFFGLASNHSVMTNSYATGAVTNSGTGGAGGLVGNANYIGVANSFTEGSVHGNSRGGGLIANLMNSSVDNSYHDKGDVSGATKLGGLIGEVSLSTINRSYASSTVTSSGAVGGAIVGGLIGNATNTNVSNSFATGVVSVRSVSNWSETADQGVGGLIGIYGGGTVTNTYATGDVTTPVPSYNVGGLIGYLKTGDVYDSYARGNVSGGDHVGGLVGSVFSGLGDAGASVNNSNAYGNVNGVNYVGGVIGSGKSVGIGGYVDGQFVTTQVDGAVHNSNSFGNVTGTGNYVGGVAGYGASITGSNASGTVTGGGDYVGGIAGQARIIDGSYFSGTVVASGQNVGAIAGDVGSVLNSFYKASTAGVNNAVGSARGPVEARALTDEQAKDAQFYLDGTIDQVLADRAAAAKAAAQAAAETAARLAAERQAAAAFAADAARTGSTIATTDPDVSSSAAPATAASIKAMQQAAKLDEVDDGLKQTEQKVKADDERHERRRKAAIAAASRPSGVTRRPAYRGTIRSIDIDGQRYELERDGTPSKSGTSAPGGGAP